MISKNAAFIKALHKVFVEYGVEIAEYGNYNDESLAWYFEGPEINVKIESMLFEGCDLTPDPVPPPPPPIIIEKVIECIVEKEVITKININQLTSDALQRIKDMYNRVDKITSGRKALYMYQIASKALKGIE